VDIERGFTSTLPGESGVCRQSKEDGMGATKVVRHTTVRALAPCLVIAALALLAPGSSLAAPPAYSLLGVWKSGYLAANGKREAANGTQTVTQMNMQTGVFSGYSEVSGVHFTLTGTESGKSLEFVQSEGGYAAHDKVPALSILPNGHVGGNGSFEAGNFWIEVQSKATSGATTEESAPEGKPAAFVSVLCNIFPSAPSTSTCTADVGDLSTENHKTPTGTVTFSTTTGTLLGTTCQLALTVGLGNVASCTVGFQPAPETQQGAPLPVIAHYSGDANFAAAEGSTSPQGASPGILTSSVGNTSGFFNVPMVNPNYSAVTGTVTVSLAGAAGSAALGHSASALATGRFSLGRFGVKTLRLKLSHAGLAKLRAKHRLKVLLSVSTLDAGKRVARHSTITLHLAKH
jgi:hypothetical protein